MNDETRGVVFSAEELLPAAWRPLAVGAPVRTFNPGLLPQASGWLFAYRMVLADGKRRIALCQLDRNFRVVEDSARPFSDQVRFRSPQAYPEVATQWFADPRLYRFGERLFIYWNTGWHEPCNHQFVQELEPRSLEPIGFARELRLVGLERQKLEKNWTFFGHDPAEIFALYSLTPYVVLHGSLAGTGDVGFTPVSSTPMSIEGYPPCHGGLRGGAPPQREGEGYLVFCHSVHDSEHGYRYAAAVVRFDGEVPFAPTSAPIKPLSLHNPFGHRRVHAALNPAVGEVIYPCGAARHEGRWIISHGINDEHCALTFLSDAEIAAVMRPLPRG